MAGTRPGRQRVALALGSGGARGYAHIGVIEVVEERGYEVVAIAGTSMGALVGGLHAAGRLGPYVDWVTTLTQRDLLRMLDPSLRAPGVIKAEKILARVSDLVGGVPIEDLPIPFTAVATDLLSRKEVWLQEGPLDAAIRASIALPSVITPVVINGRLLADGGLANPVPVSATTAAQADLTIGVSLSGDGTGTAGAAPVHETAQQRPTEEWLGRFRRAVARLGGHEAVSRVAARWTRSGGALDEPEAPFADEAAEAADDLIAEVFGPLPEGLRTWDVVELSLDALQSVVLRYCLASYPPDLLITVPKSAARTLDFHRATEMIALGRRLAGEALDAFEAGS